MDPEPATFRSARAARRIVCGLTRVSLSGDLHERAAEWSLSLPLSRRRIDRLARIREVGILFVHVPKCAGMAVCEALYGRQLKHVTMRWYAHRAADLRALPSFAILREPVERFVSAYRYAKGGGSNHNRVAAPFRDRYRRFRSLDEAIAHVEAAKSPYELDHIFRPQHWYIEDRSGEIAVDRLFTVHDPALGQLVTAYGGSPVAVVNRSETPPPAVSSEQAVRIRRLYRRDVALYEALVQAGAARPCDPTRLTPPRTWLPPTRTAHPAPCRRRRPWRGS